MGNRELYPNSENLFSDSGSHTTNKVSPSLPFSVDNRPSNQRESGDNILSNLLQKINSSEASKSIESNLENIQFKNILLYLIGNLTNENLTLNNLKMKIDPLINFLQLFK